MTQNKIALKWRVEREKACGFDIFVSQNCKVSVDWGDGQVEVYSRKLI